MKAGEARIRRLEHLLSGSRSFHVRFLEDCAPDLSMAWHRWQCDVDAALAEHDRRVSRKLDREAKAHARAR